jgi:hypothetical protein
MPIRQRVKPGPRRKEASNDVIESSKVTNCSQSSRYVTHSIHPQRYSGLHGYGLRLSRLALQPFLARFTGPGPFHYYSTR